MKFKIKNILKCLLITILLVFLQSQVALAVGETTDSTSPTSTSPSTSSCVGGDATDCLKSGKSGEIMNAITAGLNILAGSVLVIATISIIFAGIQYTTSSGDPQATTKAKQRITNTIIGLAAFFFLWAFLQWLIPGGVWEI